VKKRANLQENPKNQARDLTKVLGIILEFPQLHLLGSLLAFAT